MDEFAALVTAAVLANRLWHEHPGDEFVGERKQFLRLLKEARQVELLQRFPQRARLQMEEGREIMFVRISPPVLIREWDGHERYATDAGHFPRERLLGWMTEDSLDALLGAGEGS
jgi:hypothetical protein